MCEEDGLDPASASLPHVSNSDDASIWQEKLRARHTPDLGAGEPWKGLWPWQLVRANEVSQQIHNLAAGAPGLMPTFQT